MRFRFNLLVNGFVLVSVAVQSATAEALAHSEILNGQGMKIGDANITSTDQGFEILVKAANLSPGEDSIHIHSVSKGEGQAFTLAGDDFSPTSAPLGVQNTGPRHPHLGDHPNLVVGNNGTAASLSSAKGLIQN